MAAVWGLTGCGEENAGFSPPADQMFFPEGLLLDPRTPEDEPANYLFVANGNNDLAYNAGTIMAIDLQKFFDAWFDEEHGVFPYCEKNGDGEVDGRCVLDPMYETDAEHPCRRLALNPQVVECDESSFSVPSTNVRVGDFATSLASSTEPGGGKRLWVPVRGEPSVTFMDIGGSWPAPPELRCGQDRQPGEDADDGRCDDAFRLTHERNDPEGTKLARSPFNILVSETEHYRYAYVAHTEGGTLTLIDLDGLVDAPGEPAIVDAFPAFTAAATQPGGFGLAERPCFEDPEDPNVPSATLGCTRPLVYASWRYAPRLTVFTASGIDPADLADPGTCQYCAAPEDIGDPCAVVCEPEIRDPRSQFIMIVDPQSTSRRPVLGDVTFADERGDELLVLETNPGALLQFNTSLDSDGEPLDVPSAPPIEVCDEPTRMELYRDTGEGGEPLQRFALITCFRSASIYIVDLDTHQVVDAQLAGTGPHDLAVDPVRGMLYAANTLEASISVVDLRRESPTRFREIARIGLQEPFSR